MKSVKLSLSTLALCALVAPAIAVTPSTGAKPLNYKEVVKILGEGDDSKVSKAIVGKTVNIKLLPGGPDSLVVKKGDGLYFICDTTAKGFKSGQVISKVTKFETTHEGDLSLSLEQCGL